MLAAVSRRTLVLLVACAAAGVPASTAQAIIPSLSLSPSRAEGIATAGQVVGPFGITNYTQTLYRVRVFPTFLVETRQGAISVDTSESVVRRARSYLTGHSRLVDLRTARHVTARTRVLRLTRDHNLYAGLVFEAVPAKPTPGTPLQQVVRLGASLYLDPAPAVRHIKLRLEPPRAEQQGRKLVLLVGVANAGNMLVSPRTKITVRDAGGRIRFTHDAPGLRILPRATVDFPVAVTTILPKGRYEMSATSIVAGRVYRSKGPLVLFGPNQVATHGGRFASAALATGYQGQPEHITITWRNTGNVPFRPGADVTARVGNEAESARELGTKALAVGRLDPGRQGGISGDIALPAGRGPFTLQLRLVDGRRVLDTASVTVVREKRPGFWTRFKRWLSDHAVLVVLSLLALLAAATLTAWWLGGRRRDRGRAASPAPDAGLVDVNTADLYELQQVEGIGQRAAARIIEHREEFGAFRSVDGLLEVEGFDEERVARIRNHVRV
jgi:competence ComEA-like helix-hairpin-helix protein